METIMDLETSFEPETTASAAFDWRAALAELGPQLEAEGRACDRENRFVAANLDALQARGCFALGVPADLGGGGADYAELCAMIRALGAICGSTALALSMHTHQVVVAEWKRRGGAPTEGLLRRVAAEGVRLVSSGGSDWLPGSGAAEPVEGGWRITARKAFSSGAPDGDILMTSARHGDEVLHFALPMADPAVTVLDNWDTLGMRGTGSHDVQIEGAFVPEAAIAGRRPSGPWHPMFHMVSKAAFPLVYSAYAGVADGICAAAVQIAKRKAPDPALAMQVGELAAAHTAMDLAHAALVQAGGEGAADPVRTGRVMTLRGLVAQSALRVGELALECAGGAGFYRREGVEQRFRDLQAARFHPLTDGARRLYAGRLVLGLSIDG
jgi:alkylation response protein AidB-like acyl-CoA dehydrogenase